MRPVERSRHVAPGAGGLVGDVGPEVFVDQCSARLAGGVDAGDGGVLIQVDHHPVSRVPGLLPRLRHHHRHQVTRESDPIGVQ